MQTRFLGRVCAALVAISLLAVPGTALADDAGPVEWAGWISDSLQGLAVDYFATKEQLDNATWLPATIGSWSVEYVTSQEMAKDVRSLPEYQELYGSNPWDSSAAIRSYEGGELVSILTPEGLYNAWMWLHSGVPPYNESGGSSPLPSSTNIYCEFASSFSSSYTFSDGYTFTFSSSQLDDLNRLSAAGLPFFAWSVVSVSASGSIQPKLSFFRGSPVSASSVLPPSGAVALSVRAPSLATSLGISNASAEPLALYAISSNSTDFRREGANNTWRVIEAGPSSNTAISPSSSYYYSQVENYSSYAFNYKLYLLTSVPVYAYGQQFGTFGPPAPDPVDPVAPSSPSVDAPQSDGPIQTDVNITVTLPDGSTTVVVAPSADLQPVVQWLSIINANIVAWGGNISQWLAEIWKTLDAFRMAVDNWSVSILSAIDSLGNVVPSFDSNETNYWNTVVTYNNDVWGTARNIGQQDIQNDLDRLKGKFPFSIPWDLFAILLLFDADPVAPVLDIPLVYYDGSVTSENIHVDLSAFDSVMSLWRRLSLVGFVFALAVATRRLLSYVTVANDLVFG